MILCVIVFAFFIIWEYDTAKVGVKITDSLEVRKIWVSSLDFLETEIWVMQS